MQTELVSHQHERGTQWVAADVLGLRISFVNVFFIGTPAPGAPWVLVDAGVGDCSARIIRVAEARFGTGTRPAAIMLTHGHFDHVGAVRTLAARWDVPVYAHARELPYLTGRSSYPPADPAAGGGAMAWLSPLYPRRPIDLGERVRALPADGQAPYLPGWQIIDTPGHTPGHISLFRPSDQLLIAGDAVVTTRQESALAVLFQLPTVHRPPAYFTPDWPMAQRSVMRIAGLGPATIASGHGPPLQGQEMEAQLTRLARHFTEIGMPHSGRYVSEGGGGASLVGGAGRGAIAGLAATMPMTGAMLALGALARRGQQPPFPPRRVAAGLTKRVGLWQAMNERQRTMLTLASHFGYGAMAGAVYGAYTARRPSAIATGAAYGLLIWAASYAGWLPALHILPPPWRPPRRRALQLIFSHLVWGLSLGWLLRRR